MFRRYQVYIKMSGRWCPMGRFKEMSHALNWVVQYDTEGTVEMKIKDNELRRYIPLDEAFGMMPKKIVEDKNTNWKQEGF